MMIRNMFAEDINRQINGVIKVDQDTTDVIEQEVREYVITKELKKHFISFFDYYSDSFDKPTDDIGVWISGFFGSGKSHFLKMLSYILENKSVGGVPTVEMFRKKFADDPATFMLIDKATRGKTETILFNIDIEGSINKDKTAVLRVFAKMFYNHLGFFGENLKVAMLEQYIDQLGKTEEFRRVFEAKKGKSWVDQRKAFAFNGKFIIPTLMEVLDMSEEDAKRWFNDKTAVEFSIAQLVEDIKAYVKKQPKDFRLIFLIDEVGQYVGTDTDMLLNLQSLTEKIGSECGGKVWVMCTGQEAIDEIIKVRADEFSRIQARFKTRLSLSSSSVDEVIQKRILKKKPDVEKQLEGLYQENDSVLRNLFSFTDSILDKVYEERLVIALGSGGNGKSTFFNAIQDVMGDYACTIRSELLVASNDSGKKFELARLRGKRLAIAEELEEGRQLDTAEVKHLCSTGDINAQFKGKDVFTFKPSHSIVLCTNHMPSVKVMDSGTWDRLIVVPFRGRFRSQENEIKNYGNYLVRACGGAILSWIIDGAREYIRNDYKLDIPECIISATEQYQQENDWLTDFFNEWVALDKNEDTYGSDIYGAYTSFCSEHGERMLPMSSVLPLVEKKAGATKKRTKKGNVYQGLRIISEFERAAS